MRAAASSQSSQFPSASLQGCQMRCSTTLSLILAIALASTASVASRSSVDRHLHAIRGLLPVDCQNQVPGSVSASTAGQVKPGLPQMTLKTGSGPRHFAEVKVTPVPFNTDCTTAPETQVLSAAGCTVDEATTVKGDAVQGGRRL